MPEQSSSATDVTGIRSPLLLGLVIAAVVVGLDQWTKALASTHLSYASPVVLTPWFNLTLAHNTGAAFSFLADAGGWQRVFFIVVAVTVCVKVTLWMPLLKKACSL